MDKTTVDTSGEAFALDDPWKPSIFSIATEHSVARHLQRLDFNIAESRQLDELIYGESHWFRLPDLDGFKDTRWQAPSPPSLPSVSLESESQHEDAEFDSNLFDEITHTDHSDVTPQASPSWEHFNDARYRRRITHLSELGPEAFDAALSRQNNSSQPASYRCIKKDVALRGLTLLGLGMESLLFGFDADRQTFAPRKVHLTMSSLSREAFASLSSMLANLGEGFKRTREVANKISMSSKQLSSMHGLASAISVIMDELYKVLLHELNDCRSLLVLQFTLQRPGQLIMSLREVLHVAEGAGSDAAILSRVHKFAETTASSSPWIYGVLQQILRTAATSWLTTVSTTLGLADELGSNRRLSRALQEQAQNYAKGESELESPSVLPQFLEEQDAVAILGACACLTMLKQFDDSNILAEYHRYQYLNPPALTWSLEWQEMRVLEEQAERYDTELCEAIHSQSCYYPKLLQEPLVPELIAGSVHPFPTEKQDVSKILATSLLEIERIPSSSNMPSRLKSELWGAIHDHGSKDSQVQLYPLSFGLHLSIVSILEVQNRHLNRACLRMLFTKFKIREHFQVHHRYNFLGDGAFAARLSEALFSSDLSGTNERDKYTHAGNLGLRLEDRKTWPPGGPELRLALMGILNESYFGASTSMRSESRELPGNLSFGIRNLSEAEIQAVMDASSLNALDFLRLKYTATSPLDTVFTASAIEKYDAVFKLLLRVSRILAVMKHLTPSRRSAIAEDPRAARFRIDAFRFTEALSSYFLQSGIALPWSRFLQKITTLESDLESDKTSFTGGVETLFALRAAHEQMLDSIMFSLLLRRRQGPVMGLLEEILGTILSFAKLQLTTDALVETKEELGALYQRLREKISVFITVCRGLSQRKAYLVGATKEGDMSGESGIEQLLLRLEMNGWWNMHGSLER